MARSSDSDDYHRSSRRKRYRSSSSTSSSSSKSSDDSRSRRRRKRSRSSSPRRRRKSRDRSRERNRRTRSRSRRRSGSRNRRDRSSRKTTKRRRTPSRRRRSRSSSGDSRKMTKREQRDTGSRGHSPAKESSRDAFVVDLPTMKNDADRIRAIESVNSAGFTQQNFTSKRGQQSSKADDIPATSGDAHVSAIFGTTSLEEFLTSQAKKTPKFTDYKDTPELLVHENLYDEPERRMERWKKKIQNERRKRMVAQNAAAVA